MEIEREIDRWLEDVQGKLAKEECTVVRDFCCSVSSILRTYCDATIRLLEGQAKILPAMAQLRIMSELVINFLWCMQASSQKEFENNLGIWERYSAWEKKRLHEGLLLTVDADTKKILDSEIARLKNIIGKFMKQWEVAFFLSRVYNNINV